MVSPLDELRNALASWFSDEARERVARWRRSPQADPPTEVIARHRWLVGSGAFDALTQTNQLGMATRAEHGALAAHLATAAAEARLAPAREQLETLNRTDLDVGGHAVPLSDGVSEVLRGHGGPRRHELARAVETAAGRIAPQLMEGRAEADEAAQARWGEAAGHPDEGPVTAELCATAEQVLDLTEDWAREEVARAVGSRRGERPASWQDLAAGIRHVELDGLVRARDRWRRVAEDVQALGFEREMHRHVRVEPRAGGTDPRARLAVPSAPWDVRVALGPHELGWHSELAAADGLGRAVGLALTSPGLPVEFRHPAKGTAARALGGLMAQIPTETLALRRMRGLGAEARAVRDLATTVWLLELRGHAAATLATLRPPGEWQRRAEYGASLLRRAWQVEVPAAFGTLLAVSPSAAPARFRGRMASLALWVALREGYDEDWYRNPRAGEPIRAGCSRGGMLSAEAWAEELGAPSHAAVMRLREWLEQ